MSPSKGVRKHGNRWKWNAVIGGERVWGSEATKEAAVAARREAQISYLAPGATQFDWLIRAALRSGTINPECMIWPFATDPKGYGRVRIPRTGRRVTGVVHRVVYEAVFDKIPADREIDQTCRNKACFNPRHLEAVTRGEHARRAKERGETRRRREVCIRGHRFDDTSTYVGRPYCRRCRSEAAKFQRARFRERLL